MFDIAPSELLLVAVVAVVVIGPKDLPKAMRVAGYWVGKVRGVSRQFRSGFDAMVREAELAEMEKKWAAENERIMREHPPASLPPPSPEPAHDPAVATGEPVYPPAPAAEMAEDAPPALVEAPVIHDAPAPQPEPDKPVT